VITASNTLLPNNQMKVARLIREPFHIREKAT
jgi:hypothetical protein